MLYYTQVLDRLWPFINDENQIKSEWGDIIMENVKKKMQFKDYCHQRRNGYPLEEISTYETRYVNKCK